MVHGFASAVISAVIGINTWLKVSTPVLRRSVYLIVYLLICIIHGQVLPSFRERIVGCHLLPFTHFHFIDQL